jgi:hypothetical protein
MAENNQTPPKQGVRARERNALERIAALEADLSGLMSGVQNALTELERRVMTASEVIDAVVRVVGQETVEASVLAARDERAAAAAVQAKEGLDKALEAGQVVPGTVIGDNSIIVGVESDKDGVALKPGYIQLSMAGVKPEFKEKMVGQSAGFKFDTVDGNTFTVNGVYESAPQKTEVPVLTPEVVQP